MRVTLKNIKNGDCSKTYPVRTNTSMAHARVIDRWIVMCWAIIFRLDGICAMDSPRHSFVLVKWQGKKTHVSSPVLQRHKPSHSRFSYARELYQLFESWMFVGRKRPLWDMSELRVTLKWVICSELVTKRHQSKTAKPSLILRLGAPSSGKFCPSSKRLKRLLSLQAKETLEVHCRCAIFIHVRKCERLIVSDFPVSDCANESVLHVQHHWHYVIRKILRLCKIARHVYERCPLYWLDWEHCVAVRCSNNPGNVQHVSDWRQIIHMHERIYSISNLVHFYEMHVHIYVPTRFSTSREPFGLINK